METTVNRFYWLDILRGIAALSVVLWHWQHFFFDGSWLDMYGKPIDRSHYPLYSLLRPMYGQGWRAVELFFTLSGFFFWLYANKIYKRNISFGNYLMLRFSRLFPLHLLTLLIVIAAQQWLHSLKGSYFVYDDYRLTVFLTNLTLTSSWFSENLSFNGPVWSVSVELFLYLVFYASCLTGLKKWWQAAVMIAIGWLVRGTQMNAVGTGLMSFFAGGISYYLFNWLTERFGKKSRLAVAASIMPAVLVGAMYMRYIAKTELPLYFFELCLFPLIIITIALLEVTLGVGVGKRLSFIGDISYSSYLWHFPLQIAFVLGTTILNWNRSVFYSPWTLLLFYVLLISISIFSYNRFERPIQQYSRRKWMDRYGTRSVNFNVKTT